VNKDLEQKVVEILDPFGPSIVDPRLGNHTFFKRCYLQFYFLNCSLQLFLAEISVSDPHRFYADPDPDPAFLLNADPDPDPTCRISGFLTAANFWFD
jgi:hypothetical protein